MVDLHITVKSVLPFCLDNIYTQIVCLVRCLMSDCSLCCLCYGVNA